MLNIAFSWFGQFSGNKSVLSTKPLLYHTYILITSQRGIILSPYASDKCRDHQC
jgi:hypothetical protein